MGVSWTSTNGEGSFGSEYNFVYVAQGDSPMSFCLTSRDNYHLSLQPMTGSISIYMSASYSISHSVVLFGKYVNSGLSVNSYFLSANTVFSLLLDIRW